MATVYVRLLNEGVDVWRPVPVIPLGHNRYRLGTPDDYDPLGESWKFPPGAEVECEARELSGGRTQVAIRLATSKLDHYHLYGLLDEPPIFR